MRKNLIKSVGFLLVATLLFTWLNVLLPPKRRVEIAVDNYHDEHAGLYNLEKNTVDVLYIGSSHSFSSISPEDIYHDYGITGYVQASSCQKVWQSFYYLEEFLYTQHPKVVILDTFMALDGGAQSEEFNREAIDKMKLSPAKLRSIWTAVRLNPDKESFISYLFPALRYHDRWESLEEKDYEYFLQSSDSPAKGFLARPGIIPTEFNLNDYEDIIEQVPEINALCARFLSEIKALCDENGIDFILIKYPTCLWSKMNYLMVKQWADQNGVPYLDFNADDDLRAQANIDWSTESLDGGNHLNYAGAMKMSDWMGRYLKEHYDFADKRQDQRYSVWNRDYRYYKRCVANAALPEKRDWDEYLSELSQNGYVILMSSENIVWETYPSACEKLAVLGIAAEELQSSFGTCNLFVLKDGTAVFSKSGQEDIILQTEIEEMKIRCQSTKIIGDWHFSCLFDRTERADDRDGIQFVVLDPITKTWVDTSVWAVGEEGNFSRVN